MLNRTGAFTKVGIAKLGRDEPSLHLFVHELSGMLYARVGWGGELIKIVSTRRQLAQLRANR